MHDSQLIVVEITLDLIKFTPMQNIEIEIGRNLDSILTFFFLFKQPKIIKSVFIKQFVLNK